MNKIYRTVYNESTGTWMAVSELGKGHMPASSSGVSARGASWVLRPLVMAMGMLFGGAGMSYAQITQGVGATASTVGDNAYDYLTPGNLCYNNHTGSFADYNSGLNAAMGIAIGNQAKGGDTTARTSGIAIGYYSNAYGGLSFALG